MLSRQRGFFVLINRRFFRSFETTSRLSMMTHPRIPIFIFHRKCLSLVLKSEQEAGNTRQDLESFQEESSMK